MTDKQRYTYTVLRYVHDIVTGEFINVGVVLHAPGYRFFGAEIRHTYRRLSAAFPDLDSDAFKRAMDIIEQQLKKITARYEKDDLFPIPGNAETIAASVLPPDDSALRWSPIGAGVTKNPKADLSYLFDRLVVRYDSKSPNRRKDEDIWRTFRTKLEEIDAADKFVEKTIRSEVDELSFKHAWKNGHWHCYEPLSFDLADAGGIKDKAHRWVGHLSAVKGSPETFRTYFIVGAPTDASLTRAFNDAVTILGMSPVDVQVFTEQEADRLVSLIEQGLRHHLERGNRA